MKAIKNKVIVEVQDTKKTESGIILPDNARTLKNTREGVVVAVGDKVEVDVQVGDRVMMTNNYGYDIRDKETGQHFIVIEEEFLLAVIKDE